MSKAIGMEEKHSFVLTWELDIDTNDTTNDLKLPMSTRFGEVILTVKVKAPQHLNLACDWSTWPLGCIGRKVTPSSVLDFVDPAGGASSLSSPSEADSVYAALFPNWKPRTNRPWRLVSNLTPEYFADCAEDHPDFEPEQHRRFRFKLMFLDAEPAAYIATAPPPSQPMRVAVASISFQCPNDLRLVFPRANAELWTNADALASASPYFKTLLASGAFAESVVRGRKRARTGSVVVKVEGGREASQQATPAARAEVEAEQEAEEGAEGGWDDSDDETDNFINQSGAEGAVQGDINPDIPYREVTITETAYSTYRAVLVYLHTSHITFAPLSSSCLPTLSTAEVTRAAYIQEIAETESLLPLPVSPKAVYRLAHLLELPNLVALALAEIEDQLSIDNAAIELFSELSGLHEEVRSVVIDFVAVKWKEVKETEGMKEMQRKTKAREIPWAGEIMNELLFRLA